MKIYLGLPEKIWYAKEAIHPFKSEGILKNILSLGQCLARPRAQGSAQESGPNLTQNQCFLKRQGLQGFRLYAMYITQNPGFSAYTQHWVLYTWDELITSISQVGWPLHEFEEDLSRSYLI